MTEALGLLEEMLRIPSLSGDEGRLAAFLTGQMQRLGFRSWVDEAGNAVGERGDGERVVLLLGHMDTVPGDVPVRRDGDRLYGRGAVDAKGPLAAFIAAAADVPVPAGARLVVAGAVEEEAASSRGARHLIPRYRPAAVIIGEPSGWDHVTVGYKGRLLIDYELSAETAHTANGEASVAEQAVAFWEWVRGFSEAYGAGQTRQFERVDPSLRAIRTDGDGLSERVSMSVALRLPTGFDAAAFRQAATAYAGRAHVTFRGYEQAHRAEKNTPVVRAMLQAIRACGGEPRFSVKMGTSDMNVVGPAWGCPTIAYGPGDSDLDHTPQEHTSVAEVERGVAVLRQALTTLLAG
jgi:[amino group carrier protein]-lysine/ornithine hydrolase